MKDRKPLGRGKNLQQALEKIRKDRDLRISSLDEFDLETTAISTGNIAIDSITGVGGLPRGRIVELYGPPSSGKTTTALQTAARAQADGLNILFLDYEHALDTAYCASLGLDTSAESFLFAQPETFEQGMNAMRELVETGEVGMVIVDSVAAMSIEKELAIETGGSTFADKAKLMAQAMRQITATLKKHDVCCVFLNHMQDVIDSSPMGQQLAARGVKRTTTPGGKALKFHASMRMEFKPVGTVRTTELNELTNEREDAVTQTKVQVTVTKNKVAPPFKQCEVRVRFGKGFSQAQAVLDVLLAYRHIKKDAGGVFRFTEETKPAGMDLKGRDWIKGEENLVHQLESDAAWLERLRALAQVALDKHGPSEVAAPLDATDDEE